MLHERLYELTGDRSYNMSGNQNNNSSQPQLVKKQSKLCFTSDKKIADDEFMAAAIGDTEWLRQSLRNIRGAINFDKNHSHHSPNGCFVVEQANSTATCAERVVGKAGILCKLVICQPLVLASAQGLAPIHLASIHGRLDCLRLLVDKLKQDVNMASTTGWRPTHLAISNQTGRRSFNCLNYLLAKGANPSIANEDGISPMHQAASEGHVQCMKRLIDAGAQIDGEDCRGHKPLDLAKLWGHKKCARILAAEMWHRDKDFIAKEMCQLQKVKMLQVFKEIEADEEHRADQHFYGDIAFQQWLDARGLPAKPVGPPSVQNPVEVGATPKGKRKREPLLHANSMQAKSAGKLKEIQEEGHKNADSGVTPSRNEEGEEERLLKTSISFIEPVKEGAIDPEKCQKKVGTNDAKKPTFVNLISWSKSPKISPPEYVALLPDHYPRDEYTMLPKHSAVRQRMRQTTQHLGPVSSAGTSSRDLTADNETLLRMPKLPVDVIEKALNKDLAKKERAVVVYKCKNIMDVQKRQHYDPDCHPIQRSEVGLHMTSQIESRIFQAALQPECFPATPSTTISELSSGSSSSSSAY